MLCLTCTAKDAATATYGCGPTLLASVTATALGQNTQGHCWGKRAVSGGLCKVAVAFMGLAGHEGLGLSVWAEVRSCHALWRGREVVWLGGLWIVLVTYMENTNVELNS